MRVGGYIPVPKNVELEEEYAVYYGVGKRQPKYKVQGVKQIRTSRGAMSMSENFDRRAWLFCLLHLRVL